MRMFQAWESVLWVLMCQKQLGRLMTIIAGGQLKGMYPKVYDAA